MAHQGLVALVEPAVPADEQLCRHRLGVVPPQLARHAAEGRERLDQPEEDRLGALARQGQRERAIGIRPGHQEHGNQAPAVGEVDVDVTEVGLQAPAGLVVQRDEGLAALLVPAQHVQADALVTARVVVLVAQAAEQLGRGMALLPGRLQVALQDVVDDRLEGVQHRRHGPTPIGLGLRLREDLADLAARVPEAAGQLADAQPLQAVGLTDACVLVHLDHPPPPASWRPGRGTSVQEV